jgi:adenine-specific DNA-methyltransferase
MGYRYIGSKAQLVDAIVRQVKDVADPGAVVCDLMCGTGAVSSALADAGYTVMANDVMTYAVHHARCALQVETCPEFAGVRDFIESYRNPALTLIKPTGYEMIVDSLNSVTEEEGYFFREFSAEGSPAHAADPRNYFSPANAKRIDAVRRRIKDMRAAESITELEHSILLHTLALAANAVANIAGTYTHYLSELGKIGRSKFLMLPTPLPKRPGQKNTVIQGHAEQVAKHIACDVCYIDPPYVRRQYAANYHILETLAREDEPEARGRSGLRPWTDQYSNFCSRKRIYEAFEAVFTTMNCPYFVVSYSEDGLLPLDRMHDFFSDFGKVTVKKFQTKRYKSNENGNGHDLSEYIFHIDRAAA